MRIGLTYTGTPEKHQNYVSWLMGRPAANGRMETSAGEQIGIAGGQIAGVVIAGSVREEIEVIRLFAGDDNFEEIQTCDGLVLSGGVDIHPALYGGSTTYTKAPVDGWQMDRDLFEKKVLEFALGQGLPVLGVCRGLQLLNVQCGGTLVQDLGEAGDVTHENIAREDKQHPIIMESGSLLHAITGMEAGTANSAHHQAIDRLGAGLRVNCRAGDGAIEGIEWDDGSDKPFMIAVQWHPERMFTNKLPDDFLYLRIRDRYIDEIRNRKNSKL